MWANTRNPTPQHTRSKEEREKKKDPPGAEEQQERGGGPPDGTGILGGTARELFKRETEHL